MIRATLRVIGVPPQIRLGTLRKSIMNPMRRWATKIRKEFWKTTATWSAKPTFKKEAKFSGGIATARAYTIDKVYSALNRGTKQRWAIMSGDFVPKTKVGWLGSQPGAGHVLIRGKAMREAGLMPKPGIEARKFDEAVKKVIWPQFTKEMPGFVAAAMIKELGMERL